MITYVDTSSLLKLLVEEEGSDRVATLWDESEAVAAVVLIEVEARAALAAATRQGRLTVNQHAQTKNGLVGLLDQLYLIPATAALVAAAAEWAETEALRGYDAMHLAAALEIEATVFTSADAELCDAALRRGFHIANPLQADPD